ncbi:HIT family protein [Hoeflea sp.]|uniref:HIT family protein n=1 Tax=Hoeflea sp. TaxID=1940281 RepID=UPI0019C9E849|nr:HIT family protein [Hoeflea sp.]MBC7282827.1 HIT family protein [Hoeflea sp.]
MTPDTHARACIFCRIGRGEIEAHVIHEEDEILAFLDIGPIRPGHVQIIAREHYPYFEDLPGPLAARIMALAQKIARAQKQIYGVPRVAFMFTGGDVAHAHAHLVPMVQGDDVTSRRYIVEQTVTYRPIPTPPPADMAATAAQLRAALAKVS